VASAIADESGLLTVVKVVRHGFFLDARLSIGLVERVILSRSTMTHHVRGLPMPITATCPHCGKSGKIPDSAVGKAVRCPGCKETFRAAEQDEPSSPTVSAFVREGLLKGEQVVYVARLHWGMFVGPIAMGFVALVLVLVLLLLRSHEGISLAFPTGGLFLGSVVVLLLRVIRYFTSDFVVTNQRVLVKDGVVNRRSLEILLVKVESVSVSQPILGRVFGYGTVCIGGTGGTKESFPAIASPLDFCRHVREQIGEK
jgi:membrane protein YdbS with pleckstrin-like domain